MKITKVIPPSVRRADRFAAAEFQVPQLQSAGTITADKAAELLTGIAQRRKEEPKLLAEVAEWLNSVMINAQPGSGFKPSHFDVLVGTSLGERDGLFALESGDPALQDILANTGNVRRVTGALRVPAGIQLELVVFKFDDSDANADDDEVLESTSLPYALPLDISAAIKAGYFHRDAALGDDIYRVETLEAFTTMMSLQRGNIVFRRNTRPRADRFYLGKLGGKWVFGPKSLNLPETCLRVVEGRGRERKVTQEGTPVGVTLTENLTHFVVRRLNAALYPDEPTEEEWREHQRRTAQTVESSAFVRKDGSFSIGGYTFEGKTALGIRGSRVFTDQITKVQEKHTPGESGMDATNPVRKYVVFVLTTSARAKRSAADANAFVDSHQAKLWELAVAATGKTAAGRPVAPAEETPAAEPAVPVAADPPAADGSEPKPAVERPPAPAEETPAAPPRGNRS